MYEADFSDLKPNPIRELRKDKRLSTELLAKRTHLSTQVIRDVEKGLPAYLPRALTQFFDVISNLEVWYQEWKIAKRNCIVLPPVGLLNMSSDFHPFTQYRTKVGVSNNILSELICVPRFAIKKYEENQKAMPKVLRQFALIQAHMPSSDITRLANLGEMYFTAQEQKRINEFRNREAN